MRITFVFEGLFPGTTRSARHIEALARRFQVKGHHVSVITTSIAGERDPEELHILRLAHAPSRATVKDTNLRKKSIVKHLKQEEIQVVFAESLTPLSSLAVKAAGEAHLPAIVRVLEDRNGMVHDFAAGPRTSQRVIKKKIATLLEHATVVAASSKSCADLLDGEFHGPIHVIEKCVDLNVFRHGRTTRGDLDAFLGSFNARGRRILLYARDNLRESTPHEVFPLLSKLRAFAADALFMVVGDADEKAMLDHPGLKDIGEFVRCTGSLTGRDFFAAYSAASIFLVPPASQASAREILEAMAMGCAVACFEKTAAISSSVVIPEETGVILPEGDPDRAAEILGHLMQDEERLARMQSRAVEVARKHDLDVAIDQLEKLAVEVLGFATTAPPEADPPEAGPEEPKEASEEETETMVSEDKKDSASGSEGEGRPARRGGRRRRRAEPAAQERPAETPAADAPEKEAPVKAAPRVEAPEEAAATEAPAKDEDAYDGVTMVGEREPAGRRGRTRGRRRPRGRDGGDEHVEELGASTGIDVLDVSSSRGERRDWGPRPGLTLKDLMPFLRPPRNVLILGLGSGHGHGRVAASLQEAFKDVDSNLVLREASMMDLLGKLYRAPFVETMLDDLSRNPALFGAPFETTSGEEAPGLPAELDEFLAKVFGKGMNALVLDKRPDMVVCTHWLAFRHLEMLKEAEKFTADVVAVVSDPVCHQMWKSSVVSHYIVPNDSHRIWLTEHEVDSADVSVTGFPVSPSFAQKLDSEAVLEELGLSGKNPVVLLRPDGIGVTERVVESVRGVLDLGVPLDLVVLADGNEELSQSLSELEVPEGCAIKPLSEVKNLGEVMGVSSILVTRATQHTVAEAVATGLPLVVLRPSPGMEERLADRLLKAGLGVKAYDQTDLEHILNDLLTNRRELQRMRDAGRTRRQPDAASGAVDRIASLVR